MAGEREAMLDWLKDLFGVNRYTVAWDFERNGVRLQGVHETRYCGNGMSKRFARRLAHHMNTAYDIDGHWVVPLVRPLPLSKEDERP